jgi:hypothetical protein
MKKDTVEEFLDEARQLRALNPQAFRAACWIIHLMRLRLERQRSARKARKAS